MTIRDVAVGSAYLFQWTDNDRLEVYGIVKATDVTIGGCNDGIEIEEWRDGRPLDQPSYLFGSDAFRVTPVIAEHAGS